MIIRHYIIREISMTLLAVLAVLLLIFFSTQFVRILADVAAGILPGTLVLSLMGLQSLKNLGQIIPIATFFAILLAFGRMYRDHEMVALASCGIGQLSLVRTVLLVAPVIAIVVALCSLYLAPWAAHLSSKLEDSARHGSELSGIAAGQFRESQDGNFIMYVESIDEDRLTMYNVFVHSRGTDRQTVLFSEKGHRKIDKETGDEFLVMQNGYRYEGEPGQADYRIVKFGTHAIRVEAKEFAASRISRKELPTSELWGSRNPYRVSELQRRLVLPLSVIALAILAVPLSRARPREGRYARLFSAVLIYIIYNNLLGVAQNWVSSSKVPDFVGMWWVPVLLVVIAIAIATWQSRGQLASLQKIIPGKMTS